MVDFTESVEKINISNFLIVNGQMIPKYQLLNWGNIL